MILFMILNLVNTDTTMCQQHLILFQLFKVNACSGSLERSGKSVSLGGKVCNILLPSNYHLLVVSKHEINH